MLLGQLPQPRDRPRAVGQVELPAALVLALDALGHERLDEVEGLVDRREHPEAEVAVAGLEGPRPPRELGQHHAAVPAAGHGPRPDRVEDHHGPAPARQLGGGGHAAVAPADHDGVGLLRQGRRTDHRRRPALVAQLLSPEDPVPVVGGQRRLHAARTLANDFVVPWSRGERFGYAPRPESNDSVGKGRNRER